MSEERSLPRIETTIGSRRQFLGGALGTAAAVPLLGPMAGLVAAAESEVKVLRRKLKIGLVGCGGRGRWIAPLFQGHGGYEILAVADYFQEAADKCGDALGVDKRRRFSGLSGYQKVIDSGVDAIVLQTPPCFFAEHARAAVAAGVHVYMAKPVGVDVPSCLQVAELAKQATAKERVLFVDFQIPTDPANIEVAEWIRGGEMGKLAKVVTTGVFGGHVDPPLTATIESRLRNNTWDNDIALGGGYITIFDIHAIDGALWVLGQRPIAAVGNSRICRDDPHGDSTDVNSVIYEYADGLLHENSGVGLPNAADSELSCRFYGQVGHAVVQYWHDAHYHRRHKKPFSAEVVDLYKAGAQRNIASFYNAVTTGQFENNTVPRAVDSTLTCILGREAAARGSRMTMDGLLKENKRIAADLTGLKA